MLRLGLINSGCSSSSPKRKEELFKERDEFIRWNNNIRRTKHMLMHYEKLFNEEEKRKKKLYYLMDLKRHFLDDIQLLFVLNVHLN